MSTIEHLTAVLPLLREPVSVELVYRNGPTDWAYCVPGRLYLGTLLGSGQCWGTVVLQDGSDDPEWTVGVFCHELAHLAVWACRPAQVREQKEQLVKQLRQDLPVSKWLQPPLEAPCAWWRQSDHGRHWFVAAGHLLWRAELELGIDIPWPAALPIRTSLPDGTAGGWRRAITGDATRYKHIPLRQLPTCPLSPAAEGWLNRLGVPP